MSPAHVGLNQGPSGQPRPAVVTWQPSTPEASVIQEETVAIVRSRRHYMTVGSRHGRRHRVGAASRRHCHCHSRSVEDSACGVAHG